MASKHLFKSLFLLAITLVSIGLLTVCLVSEWWIRVDQARLEAVDRQYREEYARYRSEVEIVEKSGLSNDVSQFMPDIGAPDEHVWGDAVSVTSAARTTTAATTTTTTAAFTRRTTTMAADEMVTTSTVATSTSKADDYGVYDYSSYDDPFSEDKITGHKKIKRQTPKGEWFLSAFFWNEEESLFSMHFFFVMFLSFVVLKALSGLNKM